MIISTLNCERSAKMKYNVFKRDICVQSKRAKSISFKRFLLSFLSFLPLSSSTVCGGTYTAIQGVIQTPNFPNRFQTPIFCEWVIDARRNTYTTHRASADDGTTFSSNGNHSIVIYLTQVYVLEGLTLTEYYHSKNNLDNEIYNLGEIKLNTSISDFQSFANFLVIRLHLNTVVGTHLRVLNNFLDVYGLNITYEITSQDYFRENRCTMSICGFTGYCYDNFKEFFCECLPGFKGPHCANGPKSLCVKNGKHVCKNNGICKHVGETAYTCENIAPKTPKRQLQRNFKETVHSKAIKECGDCRISCPFNSEDKNMCECSKLLREEHNPQDIGYLGNLFIDNTTDLNSNVTLEYLYTEISQTLQICNATTSKLTINKTDYNNGVRVYFRFFGFRKDNDQLGNCMRRFADNSFKNAIEKNITLRLEPSLFLKSLTISKLYPIHEGQEFILSCMAIGSPNMAFRWYKDKMFINITTPTHSNKWMQLVQKDTNNNSGTYWSLLVVSKATELDEGQFTCQVIDDGRQQCASRRVYVTMTPTVFIQPTSVTVKQGEPFVLICRGIWINNDSCRINWLENGRKLTNNVEPLYPKGSLIKIPGINSAANYSCTCTTQDLFKKDTISVYAYNSAIEIPCKSNKNLVHWPDTAPGGISVVGCPENYTGFVTRMCLISTQVSSVNSEGKVLVGEWTEPDFSGCLHQQLNLIKRSFEKLKLGYDCTTVIKIINGYKSYVMKNQKNILSSEGERIFLLLDDVLTYIKNSRNFNNIRKIANTILDIADALLSNAKAIYTQNDIIFMQKVIKTTTFLFAQTLNVSHEFMRKEFYIAINHSCNDQTIERNNVQVVCVYYSNLVPKILNALNGSTAQYKLISDVRSVWILNDSVDEGNNFTVSVNISDWTTLEYVSDDLRAQCVVSDWGFKWNLNGCSTTIDMQRHIAICQCRSDGIFAVVYVKKLKINCQLIEVNQVLILLLYVISILLSLISIILSCIQFRSSNTAVSFVYCHCSISKLIICGIFSISTYSTFSKEIYLYVLSTILFCYLIAVSSQLSILMITYIELEVVLHKETAKMVVVEIFMVGPILVSIGNHIAHSFISLRPPSWWIKMADSLSFNVFVICLVAIVVLFVVLYWIVWNLIRKEINLGCMFIYKKYIRIKKCFCVFCAFLANLIISIFYINYFENIVLRYVLVFTFILVDFMILMLISDQHFHFNDVFTKIGEKIKNKMGTSLKSMYFFNKN